MFYGGFTMRFFKLFILLGLVSIFYVEENNYVEVTKNIISSDKIKKDLRVVQISDTHNKIVFPDNKFLIKKIKNLSPDIIIHTGDFINTYESLDNSVKLIKELSKIAPVYAIQGNHDIYANRFDEIRETLTDAGLTFLENEELIFNENNINFIGVLDSFKSEVKYLDSLKVDDSFYNVLLIHRPEYFKMLEDNRFDLFLSGHTHGGHWILPFIGSLMTSDRKLFPGKWYGEKYYNETKGFINRGIGGPQFPPRINNHPEVSFYLFKSDKNSTK